MNNQPLELQLGHKDFRSSASLMSSLAAIVAFMGLVLALASSEARAVPSFARQTGMQCTSCHTAFPLVSAPR